MRKIFCFILLGYMLFASQAIAQLPDPIISYSFENGATDDSGKYTGILMGNAQIAKMSDGNNALYTAAGYMDMSASMGQSVAAQLTDTYTITVDFCIQDNNNLSQFCWLYALGNGTSKYIGLINRAGGNDWYYEIKNGTAYSTTSSKSISNGTWHNVTIVQSSTQNILYIDGDRITSTAISLKPSAFASSITECYLGKSVYPSDALMKNTFIDNFCIYNQAFSSTQVQGIYQQTATLKTGCDNLPKEPIAYYWENTGNPLVKHKFSCDPAAMVKGDTLFIYSGEDATGNLSFYDIKKWCCFATTDMKHFWEYDTPLWATDFSWNSGKYAYAGHVTERNGKYYWYTSTNTTGIGVAVSDKPWGPFKDALGRPLLTNNDSPGLGHSWRCIDPAVLIDDDGQAWLYWGNGAVWYCKLNEDMISYDASYGIRTMTITGNSDFPYTEAPWMHKYNGKYYLSYAIGFPEYIAYAVSDSPSGPFEYQGILNEIAGNSNTNHQSILEFKGQWYFIYHNGAKQDGGGSYSRSVCIDTLSYDEEGRMLPIKMTTRGVDMIELPDADAIKEIEANEETAPFEIENNGNTILIKGDTPQYNMVNLSGQVVLNGTGNSVDIRNLSKGIYIISNGQESRKFLKN